MVRGQLPLRRGPVPGAHGAAGDADGDRLQLLHLLQERLPERLSGPDGRGLFNGGGAFEGVCVWGQEVRASVLSDVRVVVGD